MYQQVLNVNASSTRAFPPRITFAQLLEDLNQRMSQTILGKDHDFIPLLKEYSAHYEVDEDYLLQRGFRKAYRQIIEGL